MSESCAITGCDGLNECPTMGICKNCYQSMLYWGKKKPKQMIERAQKLVKYEARMNVMLPSQVAMPKREMVTLEVLPGQVNKKFKKKKKPKLRAVA
jgi:hypothetical protein